MNQARPRDFLLEIHEDLDHLNRELIHLDSDPRSAQTLDMDSVRTKFSNLGFQM